MDETTSYELFYTAFLNRLVRDKTFFLSNVSQEEAQIIAEKRMKDILIQSIPILMNSTKLDCIVDFQNARDDTLQVFNFKCTTAEIELMADIMFEIYLNTGIVARINSLGMFFTDSELKVFSPANDLKSFLQAVDTLHKDNQDKIYNYKKRDRLTSKRKSFNFGFI